MYVVYSVHTFTVNRKLLRKTFVAELMAFSEVVKSSSADMEVSSCVYTFPRINIGYMYYLYKEYIMFIW